VLSSVRDRYGEVSFPRFYTGKIHDVFPSFDGRKIEDLSAKLAGVIGQRRAPFATIGDFVNRSVDTNLENCSRVGVLQNAIDVSKINADHSTAIVSFRKKLPHYDEDSASGYLEEDLPMIVNQGDVLQAISHFLCSRGDTFLIRAFGDCVDKSGKVVERARCEAVVQRLPEYVNDTENAPGDTLGKLSEINKKFGRRYKVILFRWLDENEI
jgi:hypothetical protein